LASQVAELQSTFLLLWQSRISGRAKWRAFRLLRKGISNTTMARPFWNVEAPESPRRFVSNGNFQMTRNQLKTQGIKNKIEVFRNLYLEKQALVRLDKTANASTLRFSRQLYPGCPAALLHHPARPVWLAIGFWGISGSRVHNLKFYVVCVLPNHGHQGGSLHAGWYFCKLQVAARWV
jgi:hypothetical protein